MKKKVHYTKSDVERSLLYIEPGPVVLVTSFDPDKDEANIMTISWTIALDFAQHIAICTGPWNHSFDIIMKTKECVIAIPPASMAETVVKIGDVSGKDVDKFKRFKITKIEAEKVKAPLIEKCVANLECKVIDYVKKYGLIILEVINLWEDKDIEEPKFFHAFGDGTFVTDGKRMNLRKFMEDKIPEGL